MSILVLVGLVIAGLGLVNILVGLKAPLLGNYVLEVPKGASITSVFEGLSESGLTETKVEVIRIYSALTRNRGPIKAGRYQLTEGMDILGVLSLLREGRVLQYQATFPEGWTFEQWRQNLATLPHLEKKTSWMDRHELSKAIGIEGDPEGWLFPDTYYYSATTSDLDLLKTAFAEMQSILANEWKDRYPNDLVGSPYDALILASLVEKETGYAPDRDKISSVFLNRLRAKMRLESDPTVIYGLGKTFDGNLTRKDLKTDHSHNTYTRFGLPPTPIASPGLDSINAALGAKQYPYYYFVAKGDGRSHFSVDYEEHRRAVRRYQLAGRKKAK